LKTSLPKLAGGKGTSQLGGKEKKRRTFGAEKKDATYQPKDDRDSNDWFNHPKTSSPKKTISIRLYFKPLTHLRLLPLPNNPQGSF